MHILHYFHQKTFDIATVVNFGVVVVDRGVVIYFRKGERKNIVMLVTFFIFYFKCDNEQNCHIFRKNTQMKNEVEYLSCKSECFVVSFGGAASIFFKEVFLGDFLNASIHFFFAALSTLDLYGGSRGFFLKSIHMVFVFFN